LLTSEEKGCCPLCFREEKRGQHWGGSEEPVQKAPPLATEKSLGRKGKSLTRDIARKLPPFRGKKRRKERTRDFCEESFPANREKGITTPFFGKKLGI